MPLRCVCRVSLDGEEDVPRGWSGRKESEETEESEEGWTVPFKSGHANF